MERTQSYWEQVFKTLNEYGLKIPQSKLGDQDNANSILTEAEVIARLAPHFNVKIEPNIKELRPKKLDASIEFEGEKALIEIAYVKERIELDVAHGGISLPGGKVKSVLLTKFKGQLKEGKNDPRVPVVIILCLHNFVHDIDVENAIYGQLQFHWTTRTDTSQIIEEGSKRADNSFYEIDNSDIVTAIATFKKDYLRKDPFVGRLLRPPYRIVPKNPLSRKFRLKLRNVLFGENEDSSWESLMKVNGINEELAKTLHSSGIEDLGILATATEEDLHIEGLEIDQLKEFQHEAQRIIKVYNTGSIKYLKGIDQDTYDLLIKKKIYLIAQILKLTECPEGINPSIWNDMLKDAKWIFE